jgi:hypothetical protein
MDFFAEIIDFFKTLYNLIVTFLAKLKGYEPETI